MGPILCKTKFEVDSRVNKKALPILGWGGKSSLQKSKWRRRKCNAPWRQAHTKKFEGSGIKMPWWGGRGKMLEGGFFSPHKVCVAPRSFPSCPPFLFIPCRRREQKTFPPSGLILKLCLQFYSGLLLVSFFLGHSGILVGTHYWRRYIPGRWPLRRRQFRAS